MSEVERHQFLIFCDSPRERHPRGLTKIATLVLDRDGDLYAIDRGTWLSGNEPMDHDVVRERYFDDPVPDLRMRLEYRCRQCSRKVDVRDTSRLHQVISQAWRDGVSELSLGDLERKLTLEQ